MPHLTLEYTENLEFSLQLDELLARMHQILVEVAGIPVGNCKSRAVRVEQFYVGDGVAQSGFAHLDVRFLEGRTPTVKQQTGRRLLEVLCDCLPQPAEVDDLQITVELRDIERATYFKFPEGTLTDV